MIKKILSLISRFFNETHAGSVSTAKERMKLMVISDRHRYLPPETLERMKSEMVMVMSKYFNIDPSQTECIIESSDNRSAYISTIAPLLSNNNYESPTKRRGRPRKSKRNLSSSFN